LLHGVGPLLLQLREHCDKACGCDNMPRLRLGGLG
jgi:hypothetical protein